MNDHDCVYKDALLWWKAEALLIAAGQGGTLDRLVIAAVVPVPIPRDVAMEHMEAATAAVKAALEAPSAGGR